MPEAGLAHDGNLKLKLRELAKEEKEEDEGEEGEAEATDVDFDQFCNSDIVYQGTFDSYQAVARLDENLVGDSNVFLVRCLQSNDIYTLKIFNTDLKAREKLKILNEIRKYTCIFSAIVDKNPIPSLIDYNVETQMKYNFLIFPFMQNSVQSFLIDSAKANILTVKLLAEQFLSICDTVRRFHTYENEEGESLAHCNLKPEKIRMQISATGPQWVLVDLGRSIELPSSSCTRIVLRHRSNETFEEDVRYAAPETIPFEYPDGAQKFSQAADVWSIGAILYEIVSSSGIYEGLTKEQLINLIHVDGFEEYIGQRLSAIPNPFREFEPVLAEMLTAKQSMRPTLKAIMQSYSHLGKEPCSACLADSLERENRAKKPPTRKLNVCTQTCSLSILEAQKEKAEVEDITSHFQSFSVENNTSKSGFSVSRGHTDSNPPSAPKGPDIGTAFRWGANSSVWKDLRKQPNKSNLPLLARKAATREDNEPHNRLTGTGDKISFDRRNHSWPTGSSEDSTTPGESDKRGGEYQTPLQDENIPQQVTTAPQKPNQLADCIIIADDGERTKSQNRREQFQIHSARPVPLTAEPKEELTQENLQKVLDIHKDRHAHISNCQYNELHEMSKKLLSATMMQRVAGRHLQQWKYFYRSHVLSTQDGIQKGLQPAHGERPAPKIEVRPELDVIVIEDD
eukprot:Nk52_evm33s293 gene=Nk52_evmTU33s293